VSRRQIQIKFTVFAVLGLLAPVLGLPVWSQIALLAAALGIPAVVALYGGRRLVGMLTPAGMLAPAGMLTPAGVVAPGVVARPGVLTPPAVPGGGAGTNRSNGERLPVSRNQARTT
jgi:hypothetical protein